MRVKFVAKVSDIQEPREARNGKSYTTVTLTDRNGFADVVSLSPDVMSKIADGGVYEFEGIPWAVARPHVEFQPPRAFISWRIHDAVPAAAFPEPAADASDPWRSEPAFIG